MEHFFRLQQHFIAGLSISERLVLALDNNALQDIKDKDTDPQYAKNGNLANIAMTPAGVAER